MEFIGTKRVKATPMTRLEYNQLRGWLVPANENPNDEGYQVEYLDGGKPNHPNFKGYISWSPKDVFERAYKPVADIEQEIQAKGLTAPRVTSADIEANIRSEVYFTAAEGARSAQARIKSEYVEGERILAPLDQLTICVLVLRNGFTVTGESACASPENFDAETGRDIARQNAVQKIWPLMGYELRTKLMDRVQVQTEA